MELAPSTQFKKDLQKAKTKQNPKWKEDAFACVIKSLLNGTPLEAQYKDHQLKGEHIGKRSCHISNDNVLIYEKDTARQRIYLVRLGTHSELYKS